MRGGNGANRMSIRCQMVESVRVERSWSERAVAPNSLPVQDGERGLHDARLVPGREQACDDGRDLTCVGGVAVFVSMGDQVQHRLPNREWHA